MIQETSLIARNQNKERKLSNKARILAYLETHKKATAGHLADALNLPLTSVRPRLSDLADKERKIYLTSDVSDYVCREQRLYGETDTKSFYYQIREKGYQFDLGF